jgi:hypothetical protein
MFLKSKGYLLIESMVSLTIFIIAISLGNVVILRVFKYNTFENFEKIEVSYIFLDNLYRKIKMLDNDSNIEVKGDNVLILKEKEIKTKYEFSNGYIYVSNSKIKKRIIKCEGIKFLYDKSILEIYLKYKGETIVRVIYV